MDGNGRFRVKSIKILNLLNIQWMGEKIKDPMIEWLKKKKRILL